MRHAVLLLFILAVLLSVDSAQAGRLASITVTTFEITDKDRIQEVEDVIKWYENARQADTESLAREFWHAMFEVAAEQQNRHAENSTRDLSDEDIDEMLKSWGFEAGRTADFEAPGARLRRLDELHQARNALLYGATRGLTPSVVQDCVVSKGNKVAAEIFRPETGATHTVYYRLESIDDDLAHIGISNRYGNELDIIRAMEKDNAYPYATNVPILRQQLGGVGGGSVKLTYLVVKRVEAAARGESCTVSFPAGRPIPSAVPAARSPSHTEVFIAPQLR